ncbi:MAG: DUF512 domain-containing protein [Anaerolineae bacterium]|nr:DUF512 domain-containing protein [Anaerolineae bacterium]
MQPRGGLISRVRPGSIGEEIGLEPGDILLAINGHPLRDIIDYRYYSAEEFLLLEVERNGKLYRVEIERDYDEDLGLEFAEPLFDGLRQCENHCPFCFVQQMPRGMRRSLYVRDDDYRYSFLLGNFITLTNLNEDDWRRIEEQHLSPLYVSIHATDPLVRQRMLGNPKAGRILDQLGRLKEMGIHVHGQIVVVPGVNDGEVLAKSIKELLSLWPSLQSLALVPVGITRFHRAGIRRPTAEEAAQVLALTESYRPLVREHTGRTWLYPADEFYLLAGRAIPATEFYDDAQFENGVGLVRALLDDWARLRSKLCIQEVSSGPISFCCGQLIAPLLKKMAAEFQERTGIRVKVWEIENRFFGQEVTVSGLLTGQDVLRSLAGKPLGERLFLPRAMFDAQARFTLDDWEIDGLAQALGVPVYLVSEMSEVWKFSSSQDMSVQGE